MTIFNLFFELQWTYFELDSEEAIHCDHCHLICCVYIKGHVNVWSIQRIKAMVLCIVYAMLFVDSVNIYRENY